MENSELKQKIKEELAKQKKLIIQKFKDFDSLTYDIINSFIDYIEIGEKTEIFKDLSITNSVSEVNKKNHIQDVIIHWNF